MFGGFTRFLHAVEQLVLVGQALVSVEVVHDTALATLAQEVEVDLRTNRTPLEVEDRRRVLYLLPPLSGVHHSLNQLVVVSQEQNVPVSFYVCVFVWVAAECCVLGPDFFLLVNELLVFDVNLILLFFVTQLIIRGL